MEKDADKAAQPAGAEFDGIFGQAAVAGRGGLLRGMSGVLGGREQGKREPDGGLGGNERPMSAKVDYKGMYEQACEALKRAEVEKCRPRDAELVMKVMGDVELAGVAGRLAEIRDKHGYLFFGEAGARGGVDVGGYEAGEERVTMNEILRGY